MWRILIHGGAGMLDRARVSAETDRLARAGLSAALAAGSAVLSDGGTAVDAVAAAVAVLEDDPSFNAGRGAVLTYEGDVTLDAAIMDGATRNAGAVAGVRHTRHPVHLARVVMDASPHVMLSGRGADLFSVEQGLEQVTNDWFAIAERRQQLAELRANPDGYYDVDLKYGTVGAVALDSAGHVAAATSTGGLTGKRWGRIGDTPLIGAGTYADDRACAVSTTGAGEYFIREGVAHEIAARIRHIGETADEAARAVLGDVAAMGGAGGVIVVTAAGEMIATFTTPGMYRASASGVSGRPASQQSVAIYGDESL